MNPMATDALARALDDVIAENVRTDAKAAALLSGGGILAAALGLITAGGHAEPVTVGVAGALLAAALIASASAIRPRLANADRSAFPHWATLDRPELVDDALAVDRRRERLIVMSRLAMRKMRMLRWATDLTIGAVIALAVAAVVAATR
jgi:hypothetical protein